MKTASITQTKNQLSTLIEEVKRGETVLILDRGKPVARLVAAAGSDDDESIQVRLERLERAGIIHRAECATDPDLVDGPPARPAGSPSPLQALLEEREAGR